jgi:ribA/ribD-fused uncharacterized protein
MSVAETFTCFWTAESPFSQWHACEFVANAITYCSAEQYMMHQKAVLFHDDQSAAAILRAPDPKTQKKLGRGVKHFVPDVWEANCRKIVHDGNIAKFSQNANLKQQLFATAGTTLVEASPTDKIWGVGLKASDQRIRDRRNWLGENRLGEILTQVRDELMAAESGG